MITLRKRYSRKDVTKMKEIIHACVDFMEDSMPEMCGVRCFTDIRLSPEMAEQGGYHWRSVPDHIMEMGSTKVREFVQNNEQLFAVCLFNYLLESTHGALYVMTDQVLRNNDKLRLDSDRLNRWLAETLELDVLFEKVMNPNSHNYIKGWVYKPKKRKGCGKAAKYLKIPLKASKPRMMKAA